MAFGEKKQKTNQQPLSFMADQCWTSYFKIVMHSTLLVTG